MLLSNTLVYNHRMECGSDDVAVATLNLHNWASIRNVSMVLTFTIPAQSDVILRHYLTG